MTNTHNLDNSQIFPTSIGNSLGEDAKKLSLGGKSILSSETKVEEYAAQTTEAILARIFGEKSRTPKERSFKETCFNGELVDRGRKATPYTHKDVSFTDVEVKSVGSLQSEDDIRSSFNDTYATKFNTSLDENDNRRETLNNQRISPTFVVDAQTVSTTNLFYTGTLSRQSKLSLEEIPPRKDEYPHSLHPLDTSVHIGDRNFRTSSFLKPSRQSASFENTQSLHATFKDAQFNRPEYKHKQVKTMNEKTLTRSFNTTPVKTSKQITSHDSCSRVVESNVEEYYDRLKIQEELLPGANTARTLSSTPRKGLRSKSSEVPLRKDVYSSSNSLSKSCGSTTSRNEFHSFSGNGGKAKDELNIHKKKVAMMFRMEERTSLKRAKEFEKLKLMRKTFLAWRTRSQVLKIKADELCERHLLRKGFNGLVFAVKHQNMFTQSFVQKRRKIVLVKSWQMWQRRAHERRRKKMKETFTQWQYYKLHVERTKLLKNIAKKHLLSKKYSKWKTRFNAQQKNSLASVHFKINLLYKYWNCWAIYVQERRVKNEVNGVAIYHYGEKIQCYVFNCWRNMTHKSLLGRRLTRRRVLLKAFFHWKHWTQYAKIVHLRLQNMCKEYHKNTLTRRMFRQWRHAQKTKLAFEVCRRTQLRRALKLWNLRYMRKRLHKHLCKALARKAKKRRIFDRWICFVKQQRQTRTEFVKMLQGFHIRTIFSHWRNDASRTIQMRTSLRSFQEDRAKKIVRKRWKSWKLELKIVEMSERCKNSWSLRCVRKCCEIWKIKVKKVKLASKLHQSCSVFEILTIKRYFKFWKIELQRARNDVARSKRLASILHKNLLARILQAWRVVNQEECIIESLVRRRKRKEMARMFDAWRRFFLRKVHLRRMKEVKNDRIKKSVWELWSVQFWCLTKGKEAEERLWHLKLARHFLVWLEYVREIRERVRVAGQRKESIMRKFIQTWKKNAEKKAEIRVAEYAQTCRRRIFLRSYFTSWQRKAMEHAQKMMSFVRIADESRNKILLKKSFSRWQRQYTVQIKTNIYINMKKSKKLRSILLAWRDFASTELERQVCDFATNLAMDSSQGSAVLSTSGYQTSLKNSTSSFQFIAADDEIFSPVSTVRSRPVTPTLNHDAILPSYRPVTMERPGPPLVFDRAAVDSGRQHSLDASPQRSSEDDGVPSSGVHSAGDDSDQDDRTSVYITESLCSYQTTSDVVTRDRELLVAETIIHWRSLSLSVAFRSWYKYTRHVCLVRMTYAEWMARDREKLVTRYFGKWRRWLFVSVLARQHWVNQVKKKFLLKWLSYRKREILSRRTNYEAEYYSQKSLLKRFFNTWKQKRTSKCRLQNIVMRWQISAKVTDMDKEVIEQYKGIDRINRLKRRFCYWKRITNLSLRAKQMSQNSSLRRCFLAWRNVACWRAELRKKMDKLKTQRVMRKAFNEWLSRYEDVRTAKIIIGVSDERRTDKIFKAWRVWASGTSYRRKTSLAYYNSREQRKLKIKFVFWFAAAKKCIDMREYYHQSLQKRVLRSWRGVLIQKASTSGSIQDFQGIVLRNTLRSAFVFWQKRTKDNQVMNEYSKLKEKDRVALAFNRWTQQKKKRVSDSHFKQCLQKKTFTCWCDQIFKRRKARQHFKRWHTKAEGCKELNQVADSLVHDLEKKLLKMKFEFWRKFTQHSQVAKYHNEVKIMRSHFLSWSDHCRKEKRLLSQLEEFQQLHLRNDEGLLAKYMKIWLVKSKFSTKAEVLYNQNLSSNCWRLWRHNFVQRRVSSAMVHHDNQKLLSKVFISWLNITVSHNSLSKEIKIFCLKRWFRKWMSRYNNS